MPVEYLAAVGKRRALAGSVQQQRSQLTFQLRELMAERRLRDERPRGGLRHAAVLDYRDKVLKLPEFHVAARQTRHLAANRGLELQRSVSEDEMFGGLLHQPSHFEVNLYL